jgi:hypothetical protein
MTANRKRRDPLVWQLSSPSRVLDVRGPRVSAGDRLTGSPAPGAARAVPCVLLVSRAGDAELDAVAALLGKIGVGCLRLDAGSLAGTRVLADPGTGVLQVDGYQVMPTVTWVRHFTGRAIEAPIGGPQEMFLRDSWHALVAQLGTVSRAVIPSQGPGLLDQLHIAARLGVRVPRTVATSDLRLARDTVKTQRAVVKALAGHFVEAVPGLLTGVFPEVVATSELDAPWPRPAAPVVVQEYVEHDTELRVYYVRGEVHGFVVAKNAASDPWLDQEQVRVACTSPPPEVRVATRRITEALGLEYAALDFLVRDQTLVFLEANPDGDWRWLEARTGTATVTTAVARMLARRHREHMRALPAATSSISGGFNLLRFLA